MNVIVILSFQSHIKRVVLTNGTTGAVVEGARPLDNSSTSQISLPANIGDRVTINVVEFVNQFHVWSGLIRQSDNTNVSPDSAVYTYTVSSSTAGDNTFTPVSVQSGSVGNNYTVEAKLSSQTQPGVNSITITTVQDGTGQTSSSGVTEVGETASYTNTGGEDTSSVRLYADVQNGYTFAGWYLQSSNEIYADWSRNPIWLRGGDLTYNNLQLYPKVIEGEYYNRYNVAVFRNVFDDIASAIRDKGNWVDTYTPNEMANAIRQINCETSTSNLKQEDTFRPTTSNIVMDYPNDTGYDGVKKVTVTAAKLQNKSITPNFKPQSEVLNSVKVSKDGSNYGLGTVTINRDSYLREENIKSGITIFGITGTHTGSSVNLQENKQVSPGSLNSLIITPDSGYNAMKKVTILEDDSLNPKNILQGVTIFGVQGSYDPNAIPPAAVLFPVTSSPETDYWAGKLPVYTWTSQGATETHGVTSSNRFKITYDNCKGSSSNSYMYFKIGTFNIGSYSKVGITVADWYHSSNKTGNTGEATIHVGGTEVRNPTKGSKYTFPISSATFDIEVGFWHPYTPNYDPGSGWIEISKVELLP